MTDAAVDIKKSNILLDNLFLKCENSSKVLDELVNKAEAHVKEKVFHKGSLDTKLLEKEQLFSLLFWGPPGTGIALREMLNWAKELTAKKNFLKLKS